MLQCYKCGEKAFYCEAVSNRLFCNEEHARLYHAGWKVLLGHLKNDERLRSLGMKRAHEDGDVIVLTLNYLEYLPDEILGEILMFRFTIVGSSLAQTRAAFQIRETSVRIQRIVDEYVIARVTTLSKPVLNWLSADAIPLFTGVKSLTLDDKVLITDEGLKQMTWLEKLFLNKNGNISEKGISTMTRLRELGLNAAYNLPVCGLFNLVTLEKLSIEENETIDDEDLEHLTGLKDLRLGNYSMINGSCFWAFSSLQALTLSRKIVVKKAGLLHLAGSLKSLTIQHTGKIKDNVLSKMTALESLSLVDYHKITGDALLSLTRLTSLALVGGGGGGQDEITNNDLLKLSGLTKLDINTNPVITVDGLANMKDSLRVIDIRRSLVHLRELEDFPLLEEVVVYSINSGDSIATESLRARGVRIVFDIEL